ncbi:UPF0481 protein At3g47200-like [Carya illinoinensis]|uniref:Uncharacterized protein n=1 Tax=Carya illinoinensis TaxID=32201 RepID=A0A8T1P8R4_CARIL|nr:UPF0481 protein At3g47200-like [Carya illinoinensis]KAG6641026.1 hypothetical protein CIPAW_09G044600 [Carya illinoinensis]KAG6694368.1 hypothetical protein I3842_09G044600 [Carya illinoinensis]
MAEITIGTQDSSSRNGWFERMTRSYQIQNKSESNRPKIQNVPQMLSLIESNKKCYDPLVVSIGPYHHGKPELSVVEKHKFLLTKKYLAGTGSNFEDVYNKVAEVTKEARECYEGDLKREIRKDDERQEISDEEFTLMMCLDACFILQFMYCTVKQMRGDLGMKRDVMAFVQRDLLLLENQLPYLVLKKLIMTFKFNDGTDEGESIIHKFIEMTQVTSPHRVVSFKEILCKYISSTICSGSTVQKVSVKRETEEPVHLLQIFREKLIDANATEDEKSSSIRTCFGIFKNNRQGDEKPAPSSGWCSYRSASELKSVGIHFKPGKTRSFKDVSFKSTFLGGQLTLPQITVDDSTKSLLLNMVAYETCPDSPNDSGVTSYVCLMDTLIDTVEDVKVLRSNSVLLNVLGSDQQVADLFNGIANDLVPNPDTYSQVKALMEKHYKNRVNIWIADWLHTHFRSPWAILAFVAAVSAITLSCLQTYYAANPPNGSC